MTQGSWWSQVRQERTTLHADELPLKSKLKLKRDATRDLTPFFLSSSSIPTSPIPININSSMPFYLRPALLRQHTHFE